MNHYHETDDGEAVIIVTEGDAKISIASTHASGRGSLKDMRRAWATLRGAV